MVRQVLILPSQVVWLLLEDAHQLPPQKVLLKDLP
jgi:hypothetical protein